jgi:hypothetical protein
MKNRILKQKTKNFKTSNDWFQSLTIFNFFQISSIRRVLLICGPPIFQTGNFDFADQTDQNFL